MARIEEYTPQLEAPGPVAAVAPNLEQANAVGRSLQNVGGAVEQVGDLLHRRQAQEEVSQVYSSAATMRAQLNQQIKDGSDNGNLDQDSINQSFSDWADQQGNQYNTAEGKDAFNRQKARVGAYVTTRMGSAQAQLAGQRAVDAYEDAFHANSSVVMQDPSSFPDIYGSSVEQLHSSVQLGQIPAADEKMYQRKMGLELSKSAIMGLVQTKPDAAKAMLDSGAYDQWLGPEDKEKQYQLVQQWQHGSEVEAARKDKVVQQASDEQAENWRLQAYQKLDNNTLSPKEVYGAPITADEQHKWTSMINAASKEEMKTDPRIMNNLTRRILLPDNDPQKISDPNQIYDYVGKGISTSNLENLTGLMRKTPEGEAMNDNRKRLFDIAQAALVKKNAQMGIQDPQGEYRLLQFQSALQSKEKEYRSQQKPIGSLYDPTAPDFFGKQIGHYQPSQQDLMNSLVNNQIMPAAVQNDPGTKVSPTPGQTPEPMVKVIDPSGKPGSILQSKKDKALKAGYTLQKGQ